MMDRDQFAAAALTGLLAHGVGAGSRPWSPTEVVEHAFLLADLMVVESTLARANAPPAPRPPPTSIPGPGRPVRFP